MHAPAIVQLTHSQPTFAQLADLFVMGLRRRMYVPDHADDEVEAEFAAFRTHLDRHHYPEFCELFAGALSEQLGRERLEEMLPDLSREAAQRYLEAAPQIQQELERSLPSLTQKLRAAAQAVLSSSAGSGAKSSGASRAMMLAQSTGAHEVLHSLAQAVTREVLLQRGADAADPLLLSNSEAQRVREALLSLLVAFYARLFIQQVGEPHAAMVFEELEREPLRSYLRARSAMKPALDRGLMELVGRIMREVL